MSNPRYNAPVNSNEKGTTFHKPVDGVDPKEVMGRYDGPTEKEFYAEKKRKKGKK